MEVLKEVEFKNWKRDPTTRAIVAYLLRCQEALKSQWAEGFLSDDDPIRQAKANDSAIAQYRAITDLILLDYEQYIEVMRYGEDRESERAQAKRSSGFVQTLHTGVGDFDSGLARPRDGAGVDAGDEGDGD